MTRYEQFHRYSNHYDPDHYRCIDYHSLHHYCYTLTIFIFTLIQFYIHGTGNALLLMSILLLIGRITTTFPLTSQFNFNYDYYYSAFSFITVITSVDPGITISLAPDVTFPPNLNCSFPRFSSQYGRLQDTPVADAPLRCFRRSVCDILPCLVNHHPLLLQLLLSVIVVLFLSLFAPFHSLYRLPE
jgi:hypothetical protein